MQKVSGPLAAMDDRRGSGPDDNGARALLCAGTGTLGAGVVAAGLVETVLGGIGRRGPHTDAGWLVLMVALMSVPFGAMMLAMGATKWLRKRRRSD